ncbi:MAG: hypothetical protein K8F92_05870 [Hyphomicrobium sp.]|uniref:hypothetical protein n=1 Tax=Hyphomicrobium sp. TaxID=82 RepID=UPI0025C3688B|nr:hypothetical protein [Hyphomicrobium sp.]MBZ0209163.1 hypothetical protein [Hyphomicrobium sp.]
MKTHEQDGFDGGRAASISTNPSAQSEPEPGRRVPPGKPRRAPDQDHDPEQDARALAVAILCLTEGGDLSGD